jgi:hypothetical protein
VSITATPRPPTTGYSLWLCIPGPVRLALRARVPLDCRDHAGGECLIVAVGSGVPLRWLQVAADESGRLACKLWEVRQKSKTLAAAETTADGLTGLLQRWAREFNLGA